MERTRCILLLFLVLGVSLCQCEARDEKGERLSVLILVFPIPGHTAGPTALGEELVRRGHNVTLTTCAMEGDSRIEKMAERAGISFLKAGTASETLSEAFRQFFEDMKSSAPKSWWRVLQNAPVLVASESQAIGNFLSDLSLEQWDVILASDFLTALLSCIHHRTNIPSVLLSTTLQLQSQTLPPWPFPHLLSGTTTDDMTFAERFKTYVSSIVFKMIYKYVITGAVKDALGDFCEGVSLDYMATAPSQNFPNIVPTTIGFEFPRTIQPLSEYVGPMLHKNLDPIPGDMLAWLDSKREHSVIYISMGSMSLLTESTGRVIAEGAMNSNYSVLWSLPETNRGFLNGLEISRKQFYLSKWTPQLSVLKHKAIAMAILHGGANGVHESLANGIPLMIVISGSGGDRPVLAARVQRFGLGIYLHGHSVTADSISNGIAQVMSGEYRAAAEKLSVIFEQAGGAERAADLVEFYADVGYKHLVPAYAKYQWGWVKYHNVDVYGSLLVIAGGGMYVALKMCQCVCRRCCRKRDSKEKKE